MKRIPFLGQIHPWMSENGRAMMEQVLGEYCSAFERTNQRRPTKWEANDWLIQSFDFSIAEVEQLMGAWGQHLWLTPSTPDEDERRGTNRHWTASAHISSLLHDRIPLKVWQYENEIVIAIGDRTAYGLLEKKPRRYEEIKCLGLLTDCKFKTT